MCHVGSRKRTFMRQTNARTIELQLGCLFGNLKLGRVMKLSIFAVCAVIAFGGQQALAEVWQPAPGQIPLWPEGLAIDRPQVQGDETLYLIHKLVAGRPYQAIVDVSRPTMTIYPAKAPNTGAALLVFPGGGYGALAIDIEGTEVCDWATSIGITCVVLKYRIPQRPEDCNCLPDHFLPLQDAQRALALLRQRAASLGINPHKVGVVGFSAGGHLVTAISNAAGRTYPAVDSADAGSVRPDFAIALYPGHLWSGDKHQPFDKDDLKLEPFDHISADAPPTFIVQAEDDPMDDVRNSITYFLALKQTAVPVEIHLFAHGGHAFGLRPTAMPITHWPALAEQWLRSTGMLSGVP
jgi:acetyl esterase/lipase